MYSYIQTEHKYQLNKVDLAWRSGSVMDCNATARGSIPCGKAGVQTPPPPRQKPLRHKPPRQEYTQYATKATPSCYYMPM